jgi:hypothetical protein
MSDPQPQKVQSSLANPQVLAALIGGVVTLAAALLGVLPSIINRPPESTAVIVVTATPLPATALELAVTPLPPTDVPATTESVALVPSATFFPPTATIPPTAIPATPIPPTPIPPTTAPAQPANVLFIWDDVSFTVVNRDNRGLSFANIIFRSSDGSFDARAWGSSLPSGYCLRLRDATVGQRQPPAECGGHIYSLLEIGASAIFWRSADSFDVLQNGQVIVTCPVAAGRCEVFVG